MQSNDDARKGPLPEPTTEALDLLIQLYNANQRLAFADDEFKNAKLAKKMATDERDRVLLLVNDAVPRVQSRLALRGELNAGLPDVVKWKQELLSPQILGGPNDGAAAPEGELGDDFTGEAVVENEGKTLKFGRFTAREAIAGEWDLECRDCGRPVARVKVAEGAEPLVETRTSAKAHVDLFHAPPEAVE